MTKTVRTMGPPKDTTLTETNQAPGLESSIMPFSSFNNMTTRLYPSGEKIDKMILLIGFKKN